MGSWNARLDHVYGNFSLFEYILCLTWHDAVVAQSNLISCVSSFMCKVSSRAAMHVLCKLNVNTSTYFIYRLKSRKMSFTLTVWPEEHKSIQRYTVTGRRSRPPHSSQSKFNHAVVRHQSGNIYLSSLDPSSTLMEMWVLGVFCLFCAITVALSIYAYLIKSKFMYWNDTKDIIDEVEKNDPA